MGAARANRSIGPTVLDTAAHLRDTALARKPGVGAWGSAQMQQLGLVIIREEAFPMTIWERGDASAAILGSNHRLALAALRTK